MGLTEQLNDLKGQLAGRYRAEFFLIAQTGIISYAFTDADYTNRLDPDIILAELEIK